MHSISRQTYEVSVLICTYNGMPFLRQAVESVLNESNVEKQLVIVNDGSEDETSDYLKGFDNQHVKIIELNENNGIARAANIGLEHCDSPLVARLDADDILVEGRLRAQIDYLEANRNVDVVASMAELTETEFRQDGYQYYVKWSNQWTTNEEMFGHRFRDSPIVNPSVCFRKETILSCGGYSADGPEDYELWLRLWSLEVKMHKLATCGVNWRDHLNRLTRTHSDYNEASFVKVKLKYLMLDWERRNEDRPIYIWGKSKNARDWLDRLSQISIPIAGFVDFNSGVWRGLPVIDNQMALERDCFIFIAVRDRNGSEQIQAALDGKMRKAGRDYYFL